MSIYYYWRPRKQLLLENSFQCLQETRLNYGNPVSVPRIHTERIYDAPDFSVCVHPRHQETRHHRMLPSSNTRFLHPLSGIAVTCALSLSLVRTPIGSPCRKRCPERTLDIQDITCVGRSLGRGDCDEIGCVADIPVAFAQRTSELAFSLFPML